MMEIVLIAATWGIGSAVRRAKGVLLGMADYRMSMQGGYGKAR